MFTLQIDVMHFGDVIIGIQFQPVHDTQSTIPIGFGSDIMYFRQDILKT